MTPTLYLIPALAGTVFLLIRAGLHEKRGRVCVLKPLSTLIVIGAASASFLRPTWNPIYTTGVLAGLAFSLAGDVAMIFEERREALLAGLGSFLLAHIAYAVTFGALGRISGWDVLSTILLAACAIGVYRLLSVSLGTMRWPVLAYIVAISLMMSRAVSTLWSPAFDTRQAVLIAVGAVLFYVSDAILALCRFWRPWRYRRISLVFYYAGQLLIALAASGFN